MRVRWVSYRASLTDTRSLGPCQLYDIDLNPLGRPEDHPPAGPVLEFWHGFNSTFDDVRSAYYAQLTSLLLTGLGETPIRDIHFCLWPGGERGALSWPFAQNRAVKTAEAHTRTLVERAEQWRDGGPDYIPPSVIAHSLGNLIVCRAGQRSFQLGAEDAGGGYNCWFSLNAALDNDVLGLGGRYYLNWAKRARIFFSKNDPVLRGLYTLSSIADIGDGKAFDLALGLTGPQGDLRNLDIQAVDYTGLIDSHSGIRFSLAAAATMNQYLRGL